MPPQNEKTVKIGWCSDSHLDFMQYGLQARYDDFEHAFSHALDQMILQDVDAIIHTGDLINSTKPSPRCIRFLQGKQNQLREAGLSLLTIPGNHDATSPHWLEVVNEGMENKGFRLLRNSIFEVGGVRILGIPQMGASAFRAMMAAEKMTNIDVMLMHEPLKEFLAFETDNNVLSVADLPLEDVPLIAMGDVHTNDLRKHTTQKGEDHVYGYPGSMEMCSSSEPTQKCWVLLEFHNRRLVSFTNQLINTRPTFKERVKTTEDLDTLVGKISKYGDEHRKPMWFITYDNNVPDVVHRIRTQFNPDEFIFRFKPVFVPPQVLLDAPAQPTQDGEVPEMTLDDVLKTEVREHPVLEKIAAQLIDQNVDPEVALDEFINTRTAEIAAESQGS